MNEEIQMILDDARTRMEQALEHLEKELAHIRAGKANPRMLDGLVVDYYGSQTPLNQVSSVSTPDARTIAIQPWEKKLIPEIEKAIINANLGFNPDNNGDIIRINVPPLTEERRKTLVKDTHREGENAKVSIRTARKDANDYLKKLLKEKEISEDMEKNGADEIQAITDSNIKKVDERIENKEQEIMTV